jgi:hypothetical protein
MDNQTLAALKGSIRKWENIAAGTGVDKGVFNCPLCKLFGATHGDPERIAAAQAELDFLRSLLPRYDHVAISK